MPVQLERILLPTDFSETANQAQQYAIALAEKFQCDLHLLHVVPQVIIPLPEASTSWTLPDVGQREELDEAEARLLQLISPKWAQDHHAVQVAKVGYPVEEIVKYAKEEEIDLIVIGTHGHTGFARLLLGSTAEKIVRLATCPVLTVHPQGHQFVHDIAITESTSLAS